MFMILSCLLSFQGHFMFSLATFVTHCSFNKSIFGATFQYCHKYSKTLIGQFNNRFVIIEHVLKQFLFLFNWILLFTMFIFSSMYQHVFFYAGTSNRDVITRSREFLMNATSASSLLSFSRRRRLQSHQADNFFHDLNTPRKKLIKRCVLLASPPPLTLA